MSTSAAAVSTPAAAEHKARPALLVGALGVVFGDIGTSPIYAFRESLRAAGGAAAQATVLGILSLVFWAIVLVVALKYVMFVMRADNQGEGGTMALISLALPAAGRLRNVLLTIGLGGASLFFGDAMITPAISVLSAIEGVQIATPALKPYVVPVAAGVLIAVFAIQSRGSGRVGRLFGPVMAAWFLMLGLAGIVHLAAKPGILVALNPRYALAYVAHADGWVAFTVLGSVFLALTGGEALYADMGHFGRRAIRVDWFSLVMPALVLNYFGQGALVLSDPAAASDPFFFLFPRGLLVAVVMLTTAATVIASQAVISGAFALVQQAIQLGAVPRLEVRQTSDESAGQVYLPHINWLLVIAVFGLVLGFRSSDALANAYGIAVAGDMLVHLCVGRDCGPWSLALALVPIAARRRSISRDRCDVRLGQPAQDPRGRLVSPPGRCFDTQLDAGLAARARCGAGSP
jgi:KUP system potassium uptake protein